MLSDQIPQTKQTALQSIDASEETAVEGGAINLSNTLHHTRSGAEQGAEFGLMVAGLPGAALGGAAGATAGSVLGFLRDLF